MAEQKKENRIYLLSLLLLAVFAVCFVSLMGFLNYRTTAIDLEEQVMFRVEKDAVSGVETAVNFGKSFENYYGMDDVFRSFSEQYPGPLPFVIDRDGKLLYCSERKAAETEEDVQRFLASGEFQRSLPMLYAMEGNVIESGRFRAIFTGIHEEDDIVGYFGCLYEESIFSDSFRTLSLWIGQLILVGVVVECLALFIAFTLLRGENWLRKLEDPVFRSIEHTVTILILMTGIIAISAASIVAYQRDYRERTEDSVRIALQSLEQRISHVSDQGVNLREVNGLKDYIGERVSSLEMLRAVRVSSHISEVLRTEEESDLITFIFGEGQEAKEQMFLEAEISDNAIAKEMRGIVLVLVSTGIILLIFVFEMNHLVDLLALRVHDAGGGGRFPEKEISLALRFTGFLCSTAEYMCVPYAAMMIRASGESLFGLSVGMTAALPLTMEGLTQMVGMLTLPRWVRRFNTRAVLIFSALLMVLCNLAAFSLGGALTIILCRAIAGFAYAGFKQVSNFLITRGYETDYGRSENIAQDNAGLLAGATCGAGLGAILSANAGYAATFLCSAVLFAFYLLFTMWVTPWRLLEQRSLKSEDVKPVHFKNVVKMFSSREVLFFILTVGIPLNIGVMLCVTLIPAICQVLGISSVMLSYCYIANGIAGIYIGPMLVARAKRRFGVVPCLAFAFALTGIGIFLLRIPPVVVMIVLTSSILGFLDGFATPLTTDRFMSLRIVRSQVDEPTALIFSVVLSYVLLTFAPMVAELLLLPGRGGFSPLMLGAVLYVLAAVVLLLFGKRKEANR